MGVLVLGLALAAAGTAGGTNPVQPCSFQLSTAPPAQIVAPEDIAQRAWVMPQPDSPIAVVRVDRRSAPRRRAGLVPAQRALCR